MQTTGLTREHAEAMVPGAFERLADQGAGHLVVRVRPDGERFRLDVPGIERYPGVEI